MKRGHLITLALVLLIALALIFLFRNNPTPKSSFQKEKSMAEVTGTALELPALSPGDHPIVKKGFTLLYSEKNEEPEWVAYELSKRNFEKKAKRSDKFEPDPAIATGTATNEDYRRSGYDRGHLAPAADMSFDAEALQESFLFSNITPQRPKFNRGIWKKLEEDTRKWGEQYGTLYITTGPILSQIEERIGPDKVAVPARFFKTMLLYAKNRYWAIGFIIPNRETAKPVSAFAVPVDSVEKATGLDLYPSLPDSVEREVESAKSLPLWLLN